MDTAWLRSVVQAQFGQSALSIMPLQRPSAGRVVCHIELEDGAVGVLRLTQDVNARDEFAETARILSDLERLGYRAPRVIPCADGSPAWLHTGWSGLMTTFIKGNVISPPEPEKLRQAASLLAQLHCLAMPSPSSVRPSRFDLRTSLQETRVVLQRLVSPQPTEMITLLDQLSASLNRLAAAKLPVGIVHGDVWYMNAVETQSGEVVLIDWDLCGRGALAADLAYLLLTSHYDLSRPLDVQPDPAKVHAIIEGYCALRPITTQERDALLDLMRFALACFLRQGIESHTDVSPSGVSFHKLTARLGVTRAIADVASRMK